MLRVEMHVGPYFNDPGPPPSDDPDTGDNADPKTSEDRPAEDIVIGA